jgi:hypothetical protein
MIENVYGGGIHRNPLTNQYSVFQISMIRYGYRGELVSRFLLHEAYAQAYFKSNDVIPMPVPLADYLNELFVIPESTGVVEIPK